MTTGVRVWSSTAATNASASSSINWAEGQAPSTVNNSARQMMAEIHDWYVLLDGGTVSNGSVGGTASAITLTCSPTVLSLAAGQRYAFALGADISGTTTVNVDSLGAKHVFWQGADITAGMYLSGDWVLVVYDGTQFELLGPLPRAYHQPLDATLTALAAYNTNGLLTQTAADTFAGRTLTGTSGQITVTNGSGVAGNPTLSIPTSADFTGITVANVTLTTATLTSATAANTGLSILDTDASNKLTIVPGSNLSADRTLTVTTGDASRTVTLSGNLTVSGNATLPAGTALIAANNLSDVTASSARTNLGLGTSAVIDTGTSGAKVPLLNGNNTQSGTMTFTGAVTFSSTVSGPIPTQTQVVFNSNKVLALSDLGQQIVHSSASNHTLTIPLNASVAFPLGTRFLIANLGSGNIQLTWSGGVTVYSGGGTDGSPRSIPTNYVFEIVQITTDVWGEQMWTVPGLSF